MIQGRRYLSTVSLLVFTMESARTYKKGTRVRLFADDTYKSWIAKGLANLTRTTPLVLYSKCSGRQTRNTISSQYLIHQLHHRFLFFFSISTNLARTNTLRSYRRRMSEVCRRSRPPLQQHERNKAFPSNAAASAVRSVKLNDQRRARKKITEVESTETDAQNVIRSFETN